MLVAAERRHRVTLAEASPHLGWSLPAGGAATAPRPDHRPDPLVRAAAHETWSGFEVEYPLEADEIAALGADEVILAAGAQPDESGFQKALPHLSQLPDLQHGNVWSPEDVMGRAAWLGHAVLVLDEGGH